MPRATAANAPPSADTAPVWMPTPGLHTLPLGVLYLHPLNTRSEPPDAEIAAMAQSIGAVGLLQNLSGFCDPTPSARPAHHVGIVAGGRRLRALQHLWQCGDWDAEVPVLITLDEVAARTWAGTENEARTALHPADEIRGYAQMRARGASVPEIACAFAVPEAQVQRRLALAGLPDAAITALRAGKISLDVARALTMVTDPDELAAVLDATLAGRLASWQIRDLIEKDTLSLANAEAAYLGVAEAEAAGIRVTRDLFNDRTYLHGREKVQALARAKALAALDAVRVAEGWAWCELSINFSYSEARRIHGADNPLPDGDQARLDQLLANPNLTDAEEAEVEALERRAAPMFSDADRARAGIVGSIERRGLMIDRAYSRHLDEAATTPPGDGTDDTVEIRPAAPEAAMPQNLINDLRAIRLCALQVALTHDVGLLTALLIVQLTGDCAPWKRPFDLSSGAIPNTPERTDGFNPPAWTRAPDHKGDDAPLPGALALLAQGLGTLDKPLARALARHFIHATGDLAESVAARTPPQVRQFWTPTAAGFFSRVSVGTLDSIWCTLVPDEGSRHDGFRSLKKKDKARELDKLFSDASMREALGLSRDQNAAIDAWLPEKLRFAAPEAEAAE